MMAPLTNRQRCRILRKAVAELYAAAGGTDPVGRDVNRFISDPRVANEARVAVTMANRGELDRIGNGES